MIKEKVKVFIDTNFALLPFTQKIRVYEEIPFIITGKPEIIFIDKVIKELKKIKSPHTKPCLALIKLLVKEGRAKIIKTSARAHADTELLKHAKKNNGVICTLDKDLKQKALKEKIRVISVRQRKKIELINE